MGHARATVEGILHMDSRDTEGDSLLNGLNGPLLRAAPSSESVSSPFAQVLWVSDSTRGGLHGELWTFVVFMSTGARPGELAMSIQSSSDR